MIFDYIFLSVYFFYKLYYNVDQLFILSGSGTKLKKYINNNLQDITCNFGQAPNKFSLKSFFLKVINPSKLGYKDYGIVILVSLSIVAIKIALTYKFLISNFFYIKIFNKQLCISTILDSKYKYFKFFYYFISIYFIFCVVYRILLLIVSKNKPNKNITENGFIFLGKDENEDNVSLQKNGLYQNILITGSIGSGKTSSAITNILDSLIKNKIYGLIIDVKGNYINTVKKVLKKYKLQDRLVEISLDSSFCYNPLNLSVSSIELASIIKKVLTLISDNNSSDSYWLDKSEEYIRSFIVILRALNNSVSFYELHSMAIDPDYLSSKITEIKNNILKNKFTDEELFELNSAIQNILNEYLNLDERTLGIIKSEITRMTSIFVSDYKINKKFCSKSEILDFYSNKVVVLSIDFGSNKKIAQILSTYLKLDFQRQVVTKHCEKDIFFICDEYQEFVNEEDAHFFSISREYKCINVVSMQSYSSLINTLKNEKSANVIIQNFVNKIFFRNDDMYTIQEIIKLTGKITNKNKSFSISEGGDNSRYSMLSNKFRSYKTSLSQSFTVTETKDYNLDESYLIYNLKTFEALALISDGMKTKIYKKVKFKRWEEDINE